MNYTEGTTGHYIYWEASDDFPATYVVTENNTQYAQGDWGTGILVNVDGLEAGYYTFEITVFDQSGNSATDSVNVTVIPEGGWPPLAPPDILPLVLAIGLGATIAIIVVIVVLRKKKAEV